MKRDVTITPAAAAPSDATMARIAACVRVYSFMRIPLAQIVTATENGHQ
jgi:hypothetical protein